MVRIIPNLLARMIAKQATDKDLAKRAGVHYTTVAFARRGHPVRSGLADCIEEALDKFAYQYPRKYRKYGSPLYTSTERQNENWWRRKGQSLRVQSDS